MAKTVSKYAPEDASQSSPEPACPTFERRWGDGVARLLLAWGFWGPVLALIAAAGTAGAPFNFMGSLRYLGMAWMLVGALVALRSISRSPMSVRPASTWQAARFGLYCCVLGIVIYVAMFPTYRFYPAIGIFGGVAATYAFVVAWAQSGRRPGLGGLDVVLFNLCALLIVAEIGLTLASWYRPSVLFERLGSSVVEKVAQTRLKPGSSYLGATVNAWGFYDAPFLPKSERPPDQTMVLAIGDSFSVGAVPHPFHHTTMAERLLDQVEIYNMGVSAIGLREYLHLFLSEGLPLQPDAVVLALYLGNDFGGAVPGSERLSLASRLLDRRNLLTYLVPSRLATMHRDAEERGAVTPEAPVAEAEDLSVEELLAAYPWLEDPSLEPAHMSDREFFRVEKRMAVRASRLTDFDFKERLRRSLLPMREAARDIPVFVMMIPARFQVEDELWLRIQENTEEPLDRYRPQTVTRRWLESNGFEYLDLLPFFLGAVDTDPAPLYRNNDTHTNRRGNEVTGAALAGFLARHEIGAEEASAPAMPVARPSVYGDEGP